MYLKYRHSLYWRFRSSHISNTPPHLTVAVQHVSSYGKHPPGDFGSIICPEHTLSTPSLGDWRFRLHHILNTHRPLAIPVHDISRTRRLIGNVGSIIYLKHAPSLGDSGSSYILNTTPLAISVPSYILHMHPYFSVPALSYILNTTLWRCCFHHMS